MSYDPEKWSRWEAWKERNRDWYDAVASFLFLLVAIAGLTFMGSLAWAVVKVLLQ